MLTEAQRRYLTALRDSSGTLDMGFPVWVDVAVVADHMGGYVPAVGRMLHSLARIGLCESSGGEFWLHRITPAGLAALDDAGRGEEG